MLLAAKLYPDFTVQYQSAIIHSSRTPTGRETVVSTRAYLNEDNNQTASKEKGAHTKA